MNALRDLASQLRGEETPISPYVLDPAGGESFAPGGDYAFVIEAVREGYLLHYGEPRLLSGHDADLALLAGDYLYALGIEHLARLGDTDAVGVLANLIGRCAQFHAEGREDEVPTLWNDAIATIGGTARSDS